MTNCHGVIEITQNRFKHLMLILFALLAVFVSYHLLTGDFSGSDFAQRVEFLRLPVGISGIVFFGVCAIYAIYRFFKFRHILVIEPNGFTDYSTMAALGFVAWNDVEKISICIIVEHKLVGVNVKNIKKILVNKPWYVKRLTKGDLAMGYPPITINLNSTKEKPEEVVVIMNKYWDEWKKNNENDIKSDANLLIPTQGEHRRAARAVSGKVST